MLPTSPWVVRSRVQCRKLLPTISNVGDCEVQAAAQGCPTDSLTGGGTDGDGDAQKRGSRDHADKISTPAQFESFARQLGAPMDHAGLPEPVEIDPARVAEVCAEYQIEILGPPPPPLD